MAEGGGGGGVGSSRELLVEVCGGGGGGIGSEGARVHSLQTMHREGTLLWNYEPALYPTKLADSGQA